MYYIKGMKIKKKHIKKCWFRALPPDLVLKWLTATDVLAYYTTGYPFKRLLDWVIMFIVIANGTAHFKNCKKMFEFTLT
jgi:hypothetical protein